MNETIYIQNPGATPYPYQEPAAPYQGPTYQAPPEVDQPAFPDGMQEADQVAPEEPKPYTLKRLQSRDVFPMLRILSKIGVSELKDCFTSPEIVKAISKAQASGGEVDLSSVGVGVVFEMAGVIVDNLPKCEQEIYAFLSRLSGLKVEYIMNMDAVVFFEMIVDVIKKPEFKDFIGVVSRLLK